MLLSLRGRIPSNLVSGASYAVYASGRGWRWNHPRFGTGFLEWGCSRAGDWDEGISLSLINSTSQKSKKSN